MIMSDYIKKQVTSEVQKAEQQGNLQTEQIREIVKSAVYQRASEHKEDSSEIRSIVKDAVSAVVEYFQQKGQETQKEINAAIEGAITGASHSRREAIAKSQVEVDQLQAKIDTEEKELQEEVDTFLTDIEETGKDRSERIKSSIESAINTFKNSEEGALMQKRYAQLKAQLAVVQANLATRYGERYEDVKKYLDEAKTWYDQAYSKAEPAAENVKQKRAEFEGKLGEAGTAVARKEQRLRQLLRELWQSANEALREK